MLVPVHGYKNNFRGAAFHVVVGSSGGGGGGGGRDWCYGWIGGCFRSGSVETKKKKKKRRKINEGEKNKKILQ